MNSVDNKSYNSTIYRISIEIKSQSVAQKRTNKAVGLKQEEWDKYER